MASLSVGSLTRGTAYYYQLVATNSFGTSHGKVVEVTTDNQSAYENTVSVSPPPAGSFSGSSGGDGWMLTFSSTNVFTVFHQNPSGSNELTASCHNETSTSACAGWNGVDGTGTLPIYDSAHPTASLYPSADESVYFDPTNSYLYVWAVENLSSVYTMGVIGINTLTPSGSNVVTSIDGTFIPLSGSGEATLFTSGTKRGNYSDAVMEGTDWYSFNADNTTVGAGTHGSEDALVCFDVATGAA
jgi:hypothetical protein